MNDKEHLIKDFRERYIGLDEVDYEIECLESIRFYLNLEIVDDQIILGAIKELRRSYKRAEHNIFSTRDGNVFNIYVYEVRTKKEKEVMVAIPQHIASLIKAPSDAMKERIQDSLHLFQDVVKEIADEASEVRLSNNSSALLGANFMSHPSIPRGYYDKRLDGVLHVIDGISGERIRKDKAILTTSGIFTLKERGLADIRDDYKDVMIKWLRGDEFAGLTFKNMFILDPDTKSYLPIEKSLFKMKISTRRAAQALYEMYYAYTGEALLPAIPDSLEEAVVAYPNFQTFVNNLYKKHACVSAYQYVSLYFVGTQNSKDSSLLVPDTSPFFPGWVIEDTDYIGLNTKEAAKRGQKPLICLNTNSGVIYDQAHIPNNKQQLPADTGSFPFNFYLQINQTTVVTANRQTKNNHGELLSHEARVNEYKVSFLMTPSEKRVFDTWDAEFKEELKGYKQRLMVATAAGTKFLETKPVKPSSKEPIYLGMELEVVMKGRNSLEEFVKNMSDTSMGNYTISKHDGSIGTGGLEIVTIPATLAYHKEFLDTHFFGMPNAFNKRLMVTNACGIHVHISKNALTALDLGKFMAFINSSKNAAFINDYAGRGENRFCARTKTSGVNSKGIDISAKIVTKACSMYIDALGQKKISGLSTKRIEGRELHYDAVNIQNAHTIELRIFKSSSDRNRILRILEFCESLVKFVRCHSTQQMTVYDYVEFILANERSKFKDYHNVVRWLASKNYIGHTTKHSKDPKTGLMRNRLIHIYSENKVPFPDTLFHKNKENYREYYLKLAEPKPTVKKEA
jgi:hypothetical protein